MKVSNELGRRLDAFLVQTEVYSDFGYDRFLAARLVAELADVSYGPVLDIGTGKGIMASALASRWETTVVTVDSDTAEREIAFILAQQLGLLDRLRFVHADASVLPFGNNEFCGAVTLDRLHQLADPAPLVKEMVRVVKPGCLVILADLNRSGLNLVGRVHQAEGREHMESGVTVPQAQAIGESLGLNVVHHLSVPFHDVAVLQKPKQHEAEWH